jgi:hypothetical protein
MFSRINQVARHLSRPLPNYLHRSAAAATSRLTSSPAIMADKRTINTAACLIIGDEVLGGKVGQFDFLLLSHSLQGTSICSTRYDHYIENIINSQFQHHRAMLKQEKTNTQG